MTSPVTDPPALRLDIGALWGRVREAVASVASTEADPLDPFRGLYVSDEDAVRTARAAGGDAWAPALNGAIGLLELGRLDSAVLALCAAPELDPSYGRLFAYLHDDVTRRSATPRLVARLVADSELPAQDVLARFGVDAPLRASGALRRVEDDPLVPLADRRVKLDERLVGRMLGADLGSDEEGAARIVTAPEADPGRAEAAELLRTAVRGRGAGLPVVACGADAPPVLAWALGLPLLVLDVRKAADPVTLCSARLHAQLERAALVLEIDDTVRPEARGQIHAAIEQAGRHGTPALVTTRERSHAQALDGLGAIFVEVEAPSLAERRALWQAHADAGAGASPGMLEEAATKFRLSLGQIEHAARLAAVTGDLERGAREASRTRLGELAMLLDGRRAWSDLVLPAPQHDQLRSISAYLRHRDRVLGEWGYAANAPAQGLKVLFAGASGTGKTMAAQVIATDLGLDVYRVDLATVVSKYIGETERNLDRIFATAEGSNAIIFFDEADALFGKRSEVKDAHDRYANIEVSYLLQRMERYAGAVVLATNYRRNIDEAFLRRLDFVVEFPFPEAADRRRIWRRLLPDAAPLAPDVDVDELAERFELAGGSIANCSMSAAFMAADEGGAIEMRHLVRAVAAEYRKIGRLTLDAEFGATKS